MKRKFALSNSSQIIIAVCCLVLIISCSTTRPIVKTGIDWQSFLSQHNPVWDTLNAYYYDGPMTGNGLLGSVLHRMDKDRFDGNTNKFLFEINRASVHAKQI